MNIAAFILALAGSALSMLQPVISIPYLGGGFSVIDFLTSNLDREFFIMGCLAVAVAVTGVMSGIEALKRTGGVWGLRICGALYVIVILLVLSNTKAEQRMFMSMVFSWQKTFLVWAVCFFAASVCASIDQSTEHPQTTTYSSPSVQSSAPKPQAPTPAKTFEPVIGVETEALIKRAKIFLSDGDFDEAERYYEQALRQDPENSAAYLGKLLAQLRLHSADELTGVSTPFAEHKLFQRALEFANDDERAELQRYLDAQTTNLEAKKEAERERIYTRALQLKAKITNQAQANTVIAMLSPIVPYKDSGAIIEEVRQNIAELDEEERRRLEAEQAQQARARRRSQIAWAAAFVVVTSIAFLAVKFRPAKPTPEPAPQSVQAPAPAPVPTPAPEPDDEIINDPLTVELDRLAQEFARRENLPEHILKAGDVSIIRSYGSTFKAITGDGAIMYSLPDLSSSPVKALPNGSKLTAEAEYNSSSLGDWYFVQYGASKGWVQSRYITDREPDDDTANEPPATPQPSRRTGLTAATVTGNRVNVRSAPNTRGRVLFQLSRRTDGEPTRIIIDEIPEMDGNGDFWYRVRYLHRDSGGESWYDEKDGYIIGRYVRLDEMNEFDWMLIGR